MPRLRFSKIIQFEIESLFPSASQAQNGKKRTPTVTVKDKNGKTVTSSGALLTVN